METIKLPEYVFEDKIISLVTLLGAGNDSEEVCLDFSSPRYYIPAAIAALAMIILSWDERGKKVTFLNHDKCQAFKYLQRIDFFNICGFDLDENFFRHDPDGRFVPLQKVPIRIDPLASDIATCLAPDLAESDDIEKTGFFDCVEYSVSELGLNLLQHSRGQGLIMAQYAEKFDLGRIAIADNGIGICSSFKNTQFDDPSMTDLDAIKLSIQTEVSRNLGQKEWGYSENMGVGLPLLLDIARKLNGHFAIISGNGYYTNESEGVIDHGLSFRGTLCSFAVGRAKLNNFSRLLMSSKRDLGLIKDTSPYSGMFS